MKITNPCPHELLEKKKKKKAQKKKQYTCKKKKEKVTFCFSNTPTTEKENLSEH